MEYIRWLNTFPIIGFHRLKIISDWRAASTIISDYWCTGTTEDRRPRYNRTQEVYRAYHPTWRLAYRNSIRAWGSRTPNGCRSRRPGCHPSSRIFIPDNNCSIPSFPLFFFLLYIYIYVYLFGKKINLEKLIISFDRFIRWEKTKYFCSSSKRSIEIIGMNWNVLKTLFPR